MLDHRDDNMVYDCCFGWLDMDEAGGDLLRAIGIDVYDLANRILYRQRGPRGILKGIRLLVPKDREAIEAMRTCLDDAELRLKGEADSNA